MNTNLHYSDFLKKYVYGDDCCPYWREKDHGTCAIWPQNNSMRCPTSENGDDCPLFSGSIGNSINLTAKERDIA